MDRFDPVRGSVPGHIRRVRDLDEFYDGEATAGDATVLFDGVFEGDPTVTENVALFDFSGDGNLTAGDATVLFEKIF